MPRRTLLHVKITKAKGREYCYFRTGKKNAQGKEILVPLPPRTDLAGFGDAYASHLAARTRRERVGAELTVGMLCDLYEASPKFRELATGTKKVYRISLDCFRRMLPTAPAGLLEQSDIALLIDKRADQPGAANSLLRTINAMYKWGRARGHVKNDPGRNVEQLPLNEHEPWPDHVLADALKAKDELVRLTVHILYYTALRIGDAVALRWSDIRDGRIHVTPQKTRRTRGEMTIPIHAELAKELARHKPKGLTIIASAEGRSLHQHTVREKLKAFAGTKVVPHGLRKNAVNALLEAGCTVPETAAISGQSMGMVEIYAKRRKQGDLASAAILRWENKPRIGKQSQTAPEN